MQNANVNESLKLEEMSFQVLDTAGHWKLFKEINTNLKLNELRNDMRFLTSLCAIVHVCFGVGFLHVDYI